MNVTAVVPTIATRAHSTLPRALASVEGQSHRCATVVEPDSTGEGPAATRNRALGRVTTDWVAFLDDDDELYPNHIRACLRHATLTGADLVYPGYDAVGDDPVGVFGLPFDAGLLRRRNYIPVTVLARTELVRAVGGFVNHPDENGDPCEDWGLWLALLDVGAKFSHLPQRTWRWYVGTGTRGRTERVMADGSRC